MRVVLAKRHPPCYIDRSQAATYEDDGQSAEGAFGGFVQLRGVELEKSESARYIEK